MRCKQFVEDKDSQMMTTNYHVCNKIALYNVKFIDALRGERKELSVCGIHYQSLKKWSERMKNKMDYETEFKAERIK